MWERLARGIGHIQNHNIGNLSYEEHYRYAYNLVLVSQTLQIQRYHMLITLNVSRQWQNGDVLYSGTRKQIEEHLMRLCAEKIVPAFPPGGASSAPAGIVLPEQLMAMEPATTSFTSKGKGKEKENTTINVKKEEEDTDLSDPLANGVAMTATQGGDRADAVARTQAGERFLKAVRDTWDDHCACMGKLRDVLKYVVSKVKRQRLQYR